MDLPLLLSGILYGISSVVLSVTDPERPSKALIAGAFVPALVLIAAIIFLNFGFLPS